MHRCIPGDLFQKNRHQEGDEVKNGNDDDAQTDFIDPGMTEISILPIGRFDEMLKAFEQPASTPRGSGLVPLRSTILRMRGPCIWMFLNRLVQRFFQHAAKGKMPVCHRCGRGIDPVEGGKPVIAVDDQI
jgi:hypothetical protein